MTRWIAGLIAAVGIAGATPAHAQDATPGPGTVVVTIIPGGATFFTESKDTGRTSFGNYDLGAGVTVHLNRYIGIEGEVAGAVGVTQDLFISGRTSNLKSPNSLNYSGNLVIHAVAPHQTGAAGGMNTVMRTIGGALGGQLAATFIAGHTGRGGLPTVTGFTNTFWMATAFLVVCTLTGLLIPGRRSAGTAQQPAVTRELAP